MTTLNQSKEYFFRGTEHIEDDLKRGWSSLNFGSLGITTAELESYLKKLEKDEDEEEDDDDDRYSWEQDDNVEMDISGITLYLEKGAEVDYYFEERGDKRFKHYTITDAHGDENDIAELYSGYWVLIDDREGRGLSVLDLTEESENCETLEELIKIAEEKNNSAWGDGITIGTKGLEVVYKTDEYVILAR